MPASSLVAADFGAAIDAWRGQIILDGEVFDAARLMRSVARIRTDLFALGIEPGDLLFVAGGQHPDTLAAVTAAIDLGALAVPINPLTAPALFEELIASAGPVGIVVTRERARSVARAFTGGATDLSGDRLVYLAAPDPARMAAPVGCLGLVSSGTTGTPKIVAHLPRNALHNGRLHAGAIGLDRGERLLMTLPLHFSFGFVACLLGALSGDADIVIHEPAMTSAVFAAMVEATGATIHSATPSMLRRVRTEQPFPARLRTLSVGGDLMPPDEVETSRARFAGRFFLTYGLSEAGPRAFTREVLPGETGPFDLGKPLDGVVHRLAPLPQDRLFDVPEGHRIGELHLQTPTAMLGVWARSGLNRRDFDGDWLQTGDICLMAPDGRLFFHDRMKSIIVSGGEKISFGLIRRVLMEHRDVLAARIWAEPDAVLGQVPVASVRLRDTCAGPEAEILEDIHIWTARRLRRLERPRRIIADNTLSIAVK